MEKAPPNYYEILGVGKNATPEEVRKAYRRGARSLHPDINPGKEEEFKVFSTAYEILLDPEKRKDYNNSLIKRQARPQPTAHQREQAPQQERNIQDPKKPSPQTAPKEELVNDFNESPFLSWLYNEADEGEQEFLKKHVKTFSGVRKLFGKKK